jgi:CheY-like chemotaxis protein
MSEEQERRRVLLADDYLGMHPALTRLLMPVADVVGHVYDGAALLDAVMQLRPDIVVLDVKMPGANGWTRAGKSKRQHHTSTSSCSPPTMTRIFEPEPWRPARQPLS